MSGSTIFYIIGLTIPHCLTMAFINEVVTTTCYRRPSSCYRPLFGVPEWKAKFSPTQTTNSTQSRVTPLPLLLFPFEPTQIPLPGQHTKLKFRHGKFMDMIDESLTSYESVVGMSMFDEDGLLPIVVLCEVIEEEVYVNSGYRGFSSMEVGLRAVGRMELWDEAKPPQVKSNTSVSEDVFYGRKPLTAIQLGQFIDYEDYALSEIEAGKCLEYLKSIESLLILPSQFLTAPHDNLELIGKQALYADAYSYLSSLSTGDQYSKIFAASWAIFALLDDESKVSPIIIQAISTNDTGERLRLGLAALLESKSSTPSNNYDQNTAFQ